MSRDPNTNLWTGTPWQDESLAFEQQRDPFFAPILESFDKQCDKTEDNVNLSAYFIDEEILYKGQRCFIHKSAVPGKYDKLDPTYVGTYIVKEAVSINSYQIVDPLSGKIKTLHRNKLIPAGILMSETEKRYESEESESDEVAMPRRKRKVIPTSDRVLRSQQTL